LLHLPAIVQVTDEEIHGPSGLFGSWAKNRFLTFS
jgi:hypothetical protein